MACINTPPLAARSLSVHHPSDPRDHDGSKLIKPPGDLTSIQRPGRAGPGRLTCNGHPARTRTPGGAGRGR
eukprot:760344-Hanusia_phi.AAC.2